MNTPKPRQSSFFDSENAYVTSPLFSARILACLRLLWGFYTLFTILFTLIWIAIRVPGGASTWVSFSATYLLSKNSTTNQVLLVPHETALHWHVRVVLRFGGPNRLLRRLRWEEVSASTLGTRVASIARMAVFDSGNNAYVLPPIIFWQKNSTKN